nr:RNA-directed DNA polymerase, eukaryota, reverse transcriptase zinc-binding domain protein [Tanacetum cinerariifolium]
MQRFLRLAGFLEATAGTTEEQAKNFQWGLYKSTLNHLMRIPFADVAQVANAARNYEILHERDDDDAERPDKRQRVVIGISRPLNRVVTGTTVIIMTVMDQTGEAVSSSPGVPLRATPTRFALRVDADTQESVVELLVPASSVAKLAICRRIARRTPLRVHLVRLIRSQIDMESDVSYQEIKRAVWDCGVDKSPGPDGFTFGFIRRFWSLLENDVVAAVKYFFTSGTFPKGCNALFIALISKIPDAKMVMQAIHGVDGRIGRDGKAGHASIWCDIIKEMDRLAT